MFLPCLFFPVSFYIPESRRQASSLNVNVEPCLRTLPKMNSNISPCRFFLVPVLYSRVASAFSFSQCQSRVMSMNVTGNELEDFSSLDPARPWLLTLSGCKQLCGDGFNLWSAEDISSRFTLWILPVIIIIAHFHFSPLSGWNTSAVAVHLLGDPIDSIWSMLTRQEANRRLRRVAVNDLGTSLKSCSQEAGSACIGAIAAVWATYEELGWQDASGHTRKSLAKHEEPLSEVEIYYILRASHRLTANRSASQLGTTFAILGMLGALITAYVGTWTQRSQNHELRTIYIMPVLFEYIAIVKISGNIGAFNSQSDPVDILLELQRDLLAYSAKCKRRDEPQLFPALGFHADLSWRPKDLDEADLESQGSERAGSGTTGPGRKETGLPLGKQADPESNSPAQTAPESRNSTDPQVTAISLIKSWLEAGNWLGMNSPWRPSKTVSINPLNNKNRGPLQLVTYSALFIVLGSYLPALFISYFTFYVIGFGCFSLAWTLMLAMWVISVGADQLLKWQISLARKLWKWTLVKDAIIMCFVIGTIVILQIGVLDSCWCRSKALGRGREAVVDLAPFSDDQWARLWILWVLAPALGLVATCVLYGLVEFGGTDNGRNLCKSHAERHQELLTIVDLGEKGRTAG